MPPLKSRERVSQDNLHTRSSIGRNLRRSILHCMDTGDGYPSISM